MTLQELLDTKVYGRYKLRVQWFGNTLFEREIEAATDPFHPDFRKYIKNWDVLKNSQVQSITVDKTFNGEMAWVDVSIAARGKDVIL